MSDDTRPLEVADPDVDDFRDKTQAFGYVPLVAPDAGGVRTAALIVLSGRSFGRSYRLDGDETVIGRAPECTIRLEDDGISRNHAKVIRAENEWVIVDLRSTNGTYHEGERIQVLTLVDGTKVQLGLGTVLRFQHQDVMDERYQRSMYESKTRDPLTGAYNRGYFMEAIDREVAYSARHQQPLSLVLFDIDHFKRVNDTFGHQAGDLALKRIAASVRDTVRKEDVFARYGGEEFAVLMRNSAAELAFILAERIRRSIERLEIVHDGRRIPCTVSLGIASTTPGVDSPATLIEAADRRLYEAKRAGRNRTEVGLFD